MLYTINFRHIKIEKVDSAIVKQLKLYECAYAIKIIEYDEYIMIKASPHCLYLILIALSAWHDMYLITEKEFDELFE